MEPITITEKTRVERKLVIQTVIGSAAFYLLILLFMSMIFHFDLKAKWSLDTSAGYFDELPRMSEEAKMREQLDKVVSETPVMYCVLYKSWQYFLIGIPLLNILVGGIFSCYRSITIATLGLYHFVFSFVTLCLVLFAVLAVVISNTPFIIRPL